MGDRKIGITKKGTVIKKQKRLKSCHPCHPMMDLPVDAGFQSVIRQRCRVQNDRHVKVLKDRILLVGMGDSRIRGLQKNGEQFKNQKRLKSCHPMAAHFS